MLCSFCWPRYVLSFLRAVPGQSANQVSGMELKFNFKTEHHCTEQTGDVPHRELPLEEQA